MIEVLFTLAAGVGIIRLELGFFWSGFRVVRYWRFSYWKYRKAGWFFLYLDEVSVSNQEFRVALKYPLLLPKSTIIEHLCIVKLIGVNLPMYERRPLHLRRAIIHRVIVYDGWKLFGNELLVDE